MILASRVTYAPARVTVGAFIDQTEARLAEIRERLEGDLPSDVLYQIVDIVSVIHSHAFHARNAARAEARGHHSHHEVDGVPV